MSLLTSVRNFFVFTLTRGPIQDLGTGCPKLGIEKKLGILFFKGLTTITTINMYLLIINHHILRLQP